MPIVKLGKKVVFGFVACIGLLLGGYVLVDKFFVSYSRPGDFAKDTLQREEKEVTKPVILYGMVVNNLHIVEDFVRQNQVFADLFRGYYVGPQIQQQVLAFKRGA